MFPNLKNRMTYLSTSLDMRMDIILCTSQEIKRRDMLTSYFLKTKGKHIIAWLKIWMECCTPRQNVRQNNISAPTASMVSSGKTSSMYINHYVRHMVLNVQCYQVRKIDSWNSHSGVKNSKYPLWFMLTLNAFYPLYQRKVEKHTYTNPVDTLTSLWVL